MGKASQFAAQKEEYLKLKTLVHGIAGSTIDPRNRQHIEEFGKALSVLIPSNLTTGIQWDLLNHEQREVYYKFSEDLLTSFMIVQMARIEPKPTAPIDPASVAEPPTPL